MNKRPIIRDDGKIYESVTDAAAEVIGNPSNIVVAAKKGCTSYGHRWRYYDGRMFEDRVSAMVEYIRLVMGDDTADNVQAIVEEAGKFGYNPDLQR